MAEDDKKTDIDFENEEVLGDGIEVRSEQEQQKFESDFALKMVDTLISLNEQQISSYELPNRFFTKDELSCFGLFSKSVPVNPLPAIYPEDGFLLFRGVPVPKSVNLTSSNLEEIEHILQTSNSTDLNSIHLSDLAPDMINSYQMATQIYNDRVEKIRASYLANVKNAKTQVMEVSAAVVCGFVIILTLASLL
ncbi:hypothetical protein N9P29_00380 [bacterium]|nr:hypothetical protein [bacterium]